MSYHQQLHPWCIVRLLPDMQRRTIVRLRKRNDAEAHLRVLQQNAPTLKYEIVFDPALPVDPDIRVRRSPESKV